MAITVIDEAKTFLYRQSFNPDTTIDPIELIRDLVGELERSATPDEVNDDPLLAPARVKVRPGKKKPKARPKPCR